MWLFFRINNTPIVHVSASYSRVGCLILNCVLVTVTQPQFNFCSWKEGPLLPSIKHFQLDTNLNQIVTGRPFHISLYRIKYFSMVDLVFASPASLFPSQCEPFPPHIYPSLSQSPLMTYRIEILDTRNFLWLQII